MKPRVIMLGPSLDSMGGVASVASTLMGSRLSSECDVRYVATVSEGSKIHKALVFMQSLSRFKSLVSDCDIVHVHMALGNSFPRKLRFIRVARRAGKKVVIHMHEGRFDPLYRVMPEARKKLVASTLEDADLLIVLSEEWREYFEGILQRPPRIEVLHNAVKVPASAKRSYDTRAVLFLGKLGEGKSPDVLLRATEPLCSKYPDLEVHFGGNGNVESYKRLARDLGISEHCKFHGWVTGDAKEKLFDCCSIYCLPSRNEGMPMSVMEAMAHGLATVSTPVGGIPQLIEDGVSGYLVPVGDDKKLSACLDKLLSDEVLRRRVGENARSVISERFSVDGQAEALIRMYDEVLVK